jgi:hypothetical protein
MAAASAIWLLLLDRERPKQKPLAHGRAGDEAEARTSAGDFRFDPIVSRLSSSSRTAPRQMAPVDPVIMISFMPNDDVAPLSRESTNSCPQFLEGARSTRS